MLMKIETRGKVTKTDDPAKAGRVKCELAELDGQEYPEWIDPIFPAGWVWLPNQGDTVVILRPDGDDWVEFPEELVYLGEPYDEDHPVPDDFMDNYGKRRGFKTKAGHLLIVDDTQGKEEITIAHKETLMFSLTNAGIFLGTQDADEPFVLGAKLNSFLGDLLQAIFVHGHPSFGAPPSNAVDFVGPTGLNTKVADHVSGFIFGQKDKP